MSVAEIEAGLELPPWPCAVTEAPQRGCYQPVQAAARAAGGRLRSRVRVGRLVRL